MAKSFDLDNGAQLGSTTGRVFLIRRNTDPAVAINDMVNAEDIIVGDTVSLDGTGRHPANVTQINDV